MLLKLLIIAQLTALIISTNANVGNIEKKIMDQIFSSVNYDKRIRPRFNNTDEPVNVTVNVYIRSLSSINEEKQTFGIELTFRQEWLDERLKFEDANSKLKYLTLTSVEMIWTPDLFFGNSIKGHLHSITTPNVLLRLYPDGNILYSQRISLQLEAEFDYRKFPFDSQEFPVRIASYGYKGEDLFLKWHANAQSSRKNIDLPLFRVEKIDTIEETVLTNFGSYPYLLLRLTVARELNYYLIQVFIPCCMLVIAAYLNFWLDIKFITARVILGTATLYTLTTMINSFNLLSPRVSYTKAMDIFTGISLTFVFAAFMESIVAQAYENYQTNTGDQEQITEQTFNIKHMKQWFKSTPLNKIDAVFRIAYPIAFMAFLSVYAFTMYII